MVWSKCWEKASEVDSQTLYSVKQGCSHYRKLPNLMSKDNHVDDLTKSTYANNADYLRYSQTIDLNKMR